MASLAAKTDPGALFDALDLDDDGWVSRMELGSAARKLGWYWQEAPLYALLDLMTLLEPLSRTRLLACLEVMAADPAGPYGRVLLDASRGIAAHSASARIGKDSPHPPSPVGEGGDALSVSSSESALLVIDPQRSFTRGVWMRSLGPEGKDDVAPIRSAFERCARRLEALAGRAETMFTRCPFPPDSYGWGDEVVEVIDDDQPYFIKPGNSALWPSTNGYGDWVDSILDRGKKTIVIGGCTLNSCVRVTAVETAQRFAQRGLQVIVDTSLAGARARNYEVSPLFHGRSPVTAAEQQMSAAGVSVVAGVDWR